MRKATCSSRTSFVIQIMTEWPDELVENTHSQLIANKMKTPKQYVNLPQKKPCMLIEETEKDSVPKRDSVKYVLTSTQSFHTIHVHFDIIKSAELACQRNTVQEEYHLENLQKHF